MTRYLASLTLALACGITGNAMAASWPWEGSAQDDLAFCKGLVIGGLDSRVISDTDRTELWLAWSYLVRSGAVQVDVGDAFTAGADQFAATLDDTTVQANLDKADQTCGIRRSDRQITGW